MSYLLDLDRTTLQNLLNVTEEVVDWVKFGIHLGVQHHILLIIEKGYGDKITDCKMKLLQHWLDNDSVPSWEKVATALMKINKVGSSC